MFEFIFFVIFVGILFFTGLSMVTVLIAIAVSIIAMFLMGMIGFLFKILPWILVIVAGIWVYKNYIVTAR